MFCLSLIGTARSQVLERAHAHNDYLHNRPLFDALEHGFASVEADIFLVDGKLLVAHEKKQLQAKRTLEKLYLEPLRVRIKEKGSVYTDHDGFRLMIDIKSEAEPTYQALHELLSRYSEILMRVETSTSGGVTQSVVKSGPVQIIISGNRPKTTIAEQPVRYCGIDGRVDDLKSNYPSHLYPMISDNWNLQFLWRGVGPMPQAEKRRLVEIVNKAHANHQVVRFWATPENPSLWQALVDAKVDLINTDDLSGLQRYLLNKTPQ